MNVFKIKLTVVTFLLGSFLASNAQSLNVEWLKYILSSDSYSFGFTVDKKGNVIITGGYSLDTVDFDPDPNSSYYLPRPNSMDIFILKLDKTGKLMWAKSINGDFLKSEVSNNISTDSKDNLIITGFFQGKLDFDPGPDSSFLTGNSAIPGDQFILKLNPNGDFIWVKQLSSNNFIQANNITLDQGDNIIMNGRFGGSVDFDPSQQTRILKSQTNASEFILKLDQDGELEWVNAYDIPSFNVRSLATNNGNIYTCGEIKYKYDFDLGPDTFYIDPISSFEDAYIHKLDSNGDLIWAKTFGAISPNTPTNSSKCLDLCFDELNNLYITGTYYGNVDLDPGPGSTIMSGSTTMFNSKIGYISKLSSAGELKWAETYEIPFHALPPVISANSGKVLLTLLFSDTVIFNQFGKSNNYVASKPNIDVLNVNMNSDGKINWIQQIKGVQANSASMNFSNYINNDGSCIFSGVTKGSANFEYLSNSIPYTINQDHRYIFVEKIIETTTSIAENTFVKQPLVYPNPNLGSFSIQFDNVYDKLKIEITTLSGITVFKGLADRSNRVDITLNKPSGIYFLKVTGPNDKYAIIKLVKQ